MDAAPVNPVPDCPSCRVWLAERVALEARILALETKLRDLEDRLKPPPPKRPLEPQPPAPAKVPTGKKRGAQPGHPPHLKSFLPSERVKAVVLRESECCAACDKSLSAVANDPAPKRHQVAELPPILNDRAYWQNVPAKVWNYTLGGYQVLKKWLSYRERAILGRALKLDEVDYFRDVVRRIAAIRLLGPELDANYRAAKADLHDWPS